MGISDIYILSSLIVHSLIPLAVLKPAWHVLTLEEEHDCAQLDTACGIETPGVPQGSPLLRIVHSLIPLAVLKPDGRLNRHSDYYCAQLDTACGIETVIVKNNRIISTIVHSLIPLAVLKHLCIISYTFLIPGLCTA